MRSTLSKIWVLVRRSMKRVAPPEAYGYNPAFRDESFSQNASLSFNPIMAAKPKRHLSIRLFGERQAQDHDGSGHGGARDISVPPCTWAIERHIARPIPSPVAFCGEEGGEYPVAIRWGETPVPLSSTVVTTKASRTKVVILSMRLPSRWRMASKALRDQIEYDLLQSRTLSARTVAPAFSIRSTTTADSSISEATMARTSAIILSISPARRLAGVSLASERTALMISPALMPRLSISVRFVSTSCSSGVGSPSSSEGPLRIETMMKAVD